LSVGAKDEVMDKRELLDRYEARGDDRDFVEAKRLYEVAVEETPDDVRLLTEYGYLLECHGRFAIRAATTAYRRAIELDPEWAKPRFQLMSALAGLREPHEAIEHYRGQLEAAPDDPKAHLFLATAYLIANQFPEAEEVARGGLALAPDDAHLTNRLGEALAGEGRAEVALEQWARGYSLDPEALDGRYGSAFLLEREGQLTEAIREWRFIAEWSERRGNDLDAEWPRREIARLEGLLADGVRRTQA
jgi:tetratricopeptide (TPR) repeat protein